MNKQMDNYAGDYRINNLNINRFPSKRQLPLVTASHQVVRYPGNPCIIFYHLKGYNDP